MNRNDIYYSLSGLGLCAESSTGLGAISNEDLANSEINILNRGITEQEYKLANTYLRSRFNFYKPELNYLTGEVKTYHCPGGTNNSSMPDLPNDVLYNIVVVMKYGMERYRGGWQDEFIWKGAFEGFIKSILCRHKPSPTRDAIWRALDAHHDKIDSKGVFMKTLGVAAMTVLAVAGGGPIGLILTGAGLIAKEAGDAKRKELLNQQLEEKAQQEKAKQERLERERLDLLKQNAAKQSGIFNFGDLDAFFSDKKNLIISGIGVAAFVSLLLIGAKEKKKTFGPKKANNNSK